MYNVTNFVILSYRPGVTHQFIHHFDQDDAYSELETSRNLANYTRQIEHMDEMDEHEKDIRVNVISEIQCLPGCSSSNCSNSTIDF
jgi:hypothetical protein